MLDLLITEFDKGLRTLLAPAPTLRAYPDDGWKRSRRATPSAGMRWV